MMLPAISALKAFAACAKDRPNTQHHFSCITTVFTGSLAVAVSTTEGVVPHQPFFSSEN